MKVLKIVDRPFRQYAVKNLPTDVAYTQQSVDGNEIYYSKVKNAYYVVIK